LPNVDLAALARDSIYTRCLQPQVILDRSEEIRDLPRRQAHGFDVVSGQHSTNPVENGPDKGQEGDSVSVVVGLLVFGMAVEGPVDMTIVVVIAPV
jgi:hypothetical protein